ncbi:MAG: DUF1343 domain-containing protein [Winogradskyella sp.]|nr:DUF1343 domain-containing protein [Winogradskyella sp.]
MMFKNTVLLLVIALASCGNAVKSDDKDLKVENSKSDNRPYRLQNDNTIIVGANQTERYLPVLKGKRVGVVANQTSVIRVVGKISGLKKSEADGLEIITDRYEHIVDSMLKLNIKIKKVFSPEHGFRGKADAGELVEDGKDTKTGLDIYSLHGKHKKPTKEQLQDIDIMVFDIQDVGVRFYTYISTLHYVMEACAEKNIPLLILDRPNPNGNYVDGPVLEKEHTSFLGMHPIPLVHGMTIGEYAQMINGENWLSDSVKCELTIIPVKNYTHTATYSLPIRPSPNLPNDQSIKLYPSLGLFEGTNINAGRGSEFQFQRYGAPFLDKNHYGFSYTPVSNFGAKYPKHQNRVCYGADLSDIKAERGFNLRYIIDSYNNTTDKSKFFNMANFTKHAGTKKLQQQIEAGKTTNEIKNSWQKGLSDFKLVREKYLIYD